MKDPDATFDFAAHLRRRGIAGELLVDRVRVNRRGGAVGSRACSTGCAARAERAVAAGLPEPDAALALGMVLGEDERDRQRHARRLARLGPRLTCSR